MRRSLLPTALATLALSVLGTAAVAQPVPNSEAPKEEQVLDFEGDVIETSFLKPDATLIEGELRKATNSLLKERKDFIPEVVKSAENL